MRITLEIDDDQLARARSLSDVHETAALVRRALQEMIERESRKRLATLGGTQPDMADIPRRRSIIRRG